MTEKEYSKVVAKNLKRLAYDHGKSQVEMAKDLSINPATLSSWMTGTRTPKMPKIDMLCEYFNCSREDIMEPYVPKELPKLSSDEMAVALAYREATEERKATVRLLLGLERG